MINYLSAVSINQRNTKFALLKNSNLLPDPGNESLHTTTFDNQLIELESVDSTNNYAMARIHAGLATDGLVCLARNQLAGKGQRGKTWMSEPGQNLIMSLIIKPYHLVISRQFVFSAAVALGILETVNGFKNANWKIKWPNDIFWSDRKAAGILIENIILGENWLWSVIGIGMNLNQLIFPPEIPNPISLKQITGLDYEPVLIARELVSKIQNKIAILRNNPDQILKDFNELLYKKDEIIALRIKGELIVSTLKNVEDDGRLVTEGGCYHLGEAEFLVNC
jgi:BirA family biotin operon repressor/biotin-[acetyl-CoA-carboxylase] ligase